MRKEPHPISGAVYEELGEGVVRVDDPARGKWGLFNYDGTWVEGNLTHADPHMLLYIGGPNLPPGKDIYWGMVPPYEEETGGSGRQETLSVVPSRVSAAPASIVAKYKADPGRMTDQGMRSGSDIELEFFLKNDRRPDLIPEAFFAKSPMPGGPTRVSTARFFEKTYHDLEVERIWKRTWQMACREDDIPNVGDYTIYEVAHLSFLIVRTGPDEIKAHYNTCLHRGRILRERDGCGVKEFRCPYHGWSWKIDGSLKEITTEWDFPGVRDDVCKLPGAKVATWAGFVFINPDPNAEPLEQFLGPVMLGHYAKYKFENRYKQAHISRVMHANWKIVMEAFMEGYHVIGTHPQMLLTGSDGADTRYDVFGNFGRGGHVGTSRSSPQREIFATREEALAQYRATADFNREYLRTLIGDEVEQFSDAELNDVTFNDLFPNLHPWGGWGRMVFRFRPHGDNPDECIMDIIMLAPWPTGKPKPPAARVHRLGPDESWTHAPALGSFARVLDQDVHNMPKLQAGMKTKRDPYVWYSAYQEGKIRNFHRNYDRAMGL